jgi:hypothetical protein
MRGTGSDPADRRARFLAARTASAQRRHRKRPTLVQTATIGLRERGWAITAKSNSVPLARWTTHHQLALAVGAR